MAVDVNYVLGNSEVEHQRLMMQSRMLRPWTERFFRAAGVRPGMSVIELGCGVGDVSLIAAGMVGPGGSVLSLDRDPVYLARANQRVMAEGCADVVTVAQADLETYETDARFDAVVGRFILMYQPDPAAVVKRFARFLKPGGVMVFHELDIRIAAPTSPVCAEWDEAYTLMTDALETGGASVDFGRHIGPVFQAAGLPWPVIEGHWTTGGDQGGYVYPWIGHTLQTLTPWVAEVGRDLPAGWRLDDSLPAMMEAAVLRAGSQVVGPAQVGAWARIS